MPGGAPAGGGGSATPIDPNFAAAATVPLFLFSQTEAPAMQKEGPIVAGNFQQGQTLESQFQVQPGKCYTVLAVGAGVQEVDLVMLALTPVPGLSPELGRDKGAGHQASLGGRGQCIKPLTATLFPMPITAKWVVTARVGAGVIAGQLFSK
jgi:hypothetical protein